MSADLFNDADASPLQSDDASPAVADDMSLWRRSLGMKWFFQQRLLWIEETLRVFGYINREHIMKKFGVSMPQASADLQAFQRLYPDAMVYDKNAKRYVAR